MKGMDMTHPTDDELEALAVRLDDGRVCSPAQNSCRNGCLMLEAAALLRACKTCDAPDHGEWNAAIEAAMEAALKHPMRFAGQTEKAVRQSMADAIAALKRDG